MTQGFIIPGLNSLVNTSGQLTTTQNNGGIFVGTAPVISQNPLVSAYTSPGSFTRSPKNIGNVGDVVVCAGGGGASMQGGGGGAGGVSFSPNYPLPASSIPFSIGGGGGGAGNGGFEGELAGGAAAAGADPERGGAAAAGGDHRKVVN